MKLQSNLDHYMISLRDGAKLFVREVVKGEPKHRILYLSGMGAPHDAWSEQLDDPMDNAHSVAFDPRGVGKSTNDLVRIPSSLKDNWMLRADTH